MIVPRRRSTLVYVVLVAVLCAFYVLVFRTTREVGLRSDINIERIVLTEKQSSVLRDKFADDPELVNYVKSHFVLPPSDKDYNLTAEIHELDFSRGQSKILDSYFNRKVS